MSIHIENFSFDTSPELTTLLLADATSMLYSSTGYFNLLQKLIPDSQGIHLIAKDDQGHLLGSMTFFIKEGYLGPIANALPFFGSPCALFVPDNTPEIEDALLLRYQEIVQDHHCIGATFITSPLDPNPQRHRQIIQPDFIDSRIGLITPLPPHSTETENELMTLFHSKSRNMIRKSQQGGFRIETTDSQENWDFLQQTHQENMSKLNGATRPVELFQYLQSPSSTDINKRLYTAYSGDTPVAGLLLLYFNQTVDYFVPVILEAHRSAQPLSFLIMQAMQEAIASGFRWWNWGGTWITQESLYRFKKRLGAVDHPYYYFVNIFDQKLLQADKQEFMQHYPYFYAYPFNQVI